MRHKIFCTGSFFLLFQSICAFAIAPGPIYKVVRGNLNHEIVASGDIYSPNSSAIRISHYGDDWENKISWILPEGTYVKKGQVVLKLDTTNLEKSIDQAKSQLLSAQLNLQLAELKLKMDTSSGETNVKIKQYTFEKAKLSLQTGDYVPLNDQKKTMIDLNAAKADYMQAQKNLEQNKLSDNYRIQSLRSPVVQYQTKLSRFEKDLAKMSISAESEGFLIYNYFLAIPNGKQRPAPGVSPYPFSKIADIANTEKLQAQLFVPEIDSFSIHENTPVKMTLLSHPMETLTGKVININKISSTAIDRRGGEAASPSDLLPQTTVLVEFDTSPKDILPGMTVKATFLPPQKKNILKIPLFTIFSDPKLTSSTSVDTISNKNEAYVYMKKTGAQQWTWKKITIGQTSYGFAEVQSGLTEGDEVTVPN